MATIELETFINAPVEICFNLSRSVELHMLSTPGTNETVMKGKAGGLLEKGDQVTWRAKHFGFYQQLSMIITEMNPPLFFEDRMVKGIFKSICHEHFFEDVTGITRMKDIFKYEVPAGIAGRIFDKVILRKYMTNLLLHRNQTIKEFAETKRWQAFLL